MGCNGCLRPGGFHSSFQFHWAKEGHSTSFHGSIVAYRSSISNGSNVSKVFCWTWIARMVSELQNTYLALTATSLAAQLLVSLAQSKLTAFRRHLRAIHGQLSFGFFWSLWPRDIVGISTLRKSEIEFQEFMFRFSQEVLHFVEVCEQWRSQSDFLIALRGVLDSCCPLRCFKQFDHPAALATCDVARFLLTSRKGSAWVSGILSLLSGLALPKTSVGDGKR